MAKRRISFENEMRLSLNIQFIKENLIPKDILDNMIQRLLISIEDAMEIRAVGTRREMVDRLIEKLLFVGDKYNVFHDILCECGYSYIADKLEGTNVESNNDKVAEHDESCGKNINTGSVSYRTDNTVNRNMSETPVDETDSGGAAFSTKKDYSASSESDDNYLQVIHSEQKEISRLENPVKNRKGLITNDKRDIVVRDQPNAYDRQNEKPNYEVVTYVNEDFSQNKYFLNAEETCSSENTQKTNNLSVLTRQSDDCDSQIDSIDYESVVKPSSPDHCYQSLKTTTQHVYSNIDNPGDEINPHMKEMLQPQCGSGSEQYYVNDACSYSPPSRVDITDEYKNDEESYYDVGNTVEDHSHKPESKKSTERADELEVSTPTSNVLLKEPIISGMSKNASPRNEQIDGRYSRELADFPGWDENMTDKKIKDFTEKHIKEQGQYVIWYSVIKSTIVVAVRNPNPGKNCLFYKVKEDRQDGKVYYRFGEKSGFRAESVLEVLNHVKRNGLPLMEKATRRSYKE